MKKPIDREYIQLIPEKILQAWNAIEAIIKPAMIAHRKGYNADYLREVISIISKHIRKDDEHTPLKTDYIGRLVPSGEIYLLELVNHRIVKRSGQYKPGDTSYRYNFHKQFKSKYVRYTLENAQLKRRIYTVYDELLKQARKTTWGRSEQLRDLHRLSISPQWEGVLNKPLTTDQYNYFVSSAQRIINGEINYSVDNTSGRFHSNLTNMPKELRDYVRIDGTRLVNIDLKNSQPYLSTILLTAPFKVSKLAISSEFAFVLTNLQVMDHKPDVKLYITLVVEGKLYEYLQEFFNAAGIPHTRDETKVQVLRIMFAPNRTPADKVNKEARRIFRMCFPNVHRIFNKVRGNGRGKNPHESYKRFAILMQSLESFLILEAVLKAIRAELPGVIAMTIHDSIMTGEDARTGIMTNNVAGVIRIMERELLKFVGLKPTIAVEGIKKAIEQKNHEVVYN